MSVQLRRQGPAFSIQSTAPRTVQDIERCVQDSLGYRARLLGKTRNQSAESRIQSTASRTVQETKHCVKDSVGYRALRLGQSGIHCTPSGIQSTVSRIQSSASRTVQDTEHCVQDSLGYKAQALRLRQSIKECIVTRTVLETTLLWIERSKRKCFASKTLDVVIFL